MAESPAKILVLEDERPLAKALELKLGHAGYAPTVAFDGEAGIQELDTNHFDMLIMDLVMPKKDGMAVLEHMHSKGLKIPTIVLSNLGQNEDKDKAAQYNILGYFVKSDTPLTDIISFVHKHLQS